MKTLVILAGGKSSRMGEDKTFIKYKGKTFLETLLDNAQGLFGRVIISGGSKEHSEEIYNYLKANNKTCSVLTPEIYADNYDSIGPMGGVLSVFEQAKPDKFALVSVDMPMADLKVLSLLYNSVENSEDEVTHASLTKPAVVLADSEGKAIPSAGIYTKAGYDILKESMEKGQYSLFKALGENMGLLSPARLVRIQPSLGKVDFDAAFKNYNTKEDLKTLR